MKERKKSLQEKFLEVEKLGVLSKLIIKSLQYCTDCDGMCSISCDAWYCEIKRVPSIIRNYNNEL